jgi:multidrug resistance efflux pump
MAFYRTNPISTASRGVPALRTARVVKGDLKQTIRVSGIVGAKSFAPIVSPQLRGRDSGASQMILVKLVAPGSRVKKGDVIAEFDRQWQLQRIDDQEAGVVQAEAAISKRKAELAIARESALQNLRMARAEMEKARLDLRTAEVRSAIDAEKLRLILEEATARYQQLQADVPLMEASHAAEIRALELARDEQRLDKERAVRNAERMLIRAPMDGAAVMQTTFRGNQPGTVQEGDQVRSGSLFMQIVDPSTMVLNASVNQTESQRFRLGQEAQIRLDAYPAESWPGKLIAVGAMAGASIYGMRRGGGRAEWVREIPVRFSIQAEDPRIIPDLSASADVLLAAEEDALIAPREAFEWSDGKTYATVRNQEGQWERREVQLGLTNATHAVVREGLELGEEVALEAHF